MEIPVEQDSYALDFVLIGQRGASALDTRMDIYGWSKIRSLVGMKLVFGMRKKS